MRVWFLYALVLISCLAHGAACLAQEPAGETSKAETPAADANSSDSGPVAEFKQQFAEWKKVLSKLQELQLQYKVTKPEDRAAIEAEYNKAVATGHEKLPMLVEAAEKSYSADPQADPEVTNFLVSLAFSNLKNDMYEDAFRLSKLLADNKAPVPQVDLWAGTAAFALNDYDEAEKYLKLAQENNQIDEEGKGYLALIPEYKELWAKEKTIREKEAKDDDLPRVLLKTNEGDIVIELFENEAPNTVANFLSLVEKGFYNGLTFHRVLHGFMAQGGDPKGDGSGGPGYTIACECYDENHRNHFRGTLSMAHAGKDTGGSQFFITFRQTPHLNGRHTVFGRVIEGFDVLSKLQQRNPQQTRDAAIDPDKIVEATVLRKRDHEYKPETKPDGK